MRREFKCMDCRKECDSPQYKDSIWLPVAGPKELLCIQCFEIRLGRRIVFEDLEDCPLTRIIIKTYERIFMAS